MILRQSDKLSDRNTQVEQLPLIGRQVIWEPSSCKTKIIWEGESLSEENNNFFDNGGTVTKLGAVKDQKKVYHETEKGQILLYTKLVKIQIFSMYGAPLFF